MTCVNCKCKDESVVNWEERIAEAKLNLEAATEQVFQAVRLLRARNGKKKQLFDALDTHDVAQARLWDIEDDRWMTETFSIPDVPFDE